ncbi:MAG: hypothetical protein JWP82_1193 [Humibacillus sp.]|nr:hypothetical protein [Humibacillus sp.]
MTDHDDLTSGSTPDPRPTGPTASTPAAPSYPTAPPTAAYAYPGAVPQAVTTSGSPTGAPADAPPHVPTPGVGLSDDGDAPGAAPRGRRTGLVVGGVVAALVLGGGAVFAAQRLSGGGAQPADVLPSDAYAYLRLDIDPSAGQKIAAVRFLGRLPQVKDTLDSGDPRKKLWDLATKSASSDCLAKVSYDSDIAPWLGDRVGAALRPGGTAKTPNIAIALQVKDESAAQATLNRLFACDTGGTGTDLRMKDGYALITPKGAGDATLAAVEKGSLAQNANFSADMAALGEQGVASTWFDLGTGLKEVQNLAGGSGSDMPKLDAASLAAAKGRIAAALRFDAAYVEMAGVVRGGDPAMAVKGDGSEIASLPANTMAAINISGADRMIDKMWPQVKKQVDQLSSTGVDPLAEIEQQLGLSLPDDLKVLLGRSFTLAAPEQGTSADIPTVGAKVVSSDAKRADSLVGRLLETAGAPDGALTHTVDGDKVFVATTPGYADDLKAGGKLGDTDAFKQAVGDVSAANFTIYVDLDKVAALTKGSMSGEAKSFLDSLKSAGVTASSTGTGEGSFSLRLVGD